MTTDEHDSPSRACDGCALTRREAMGRALAALTVAFLADGLAPRAVAALTTHVTGITGRAAGANVKAFAVPTRMRAVREG